MPPTAAGTTPAHETPTADGHPPTARTPDTRQRVQVAIPRALLDALDAEVAARRAARPHDTRICRTGVLLDVVADWAAARKGGA
jgi:hypothetical protein